MRFVPHLSDRSLPWAHALLCLAGALALAGCGGEGIQGRESTTYRFLTLVLNVSDPDGAVLPGCTIWLDGVAQPERTAAQSALLSDGPVEWSGYPYNWRLNRYPVRFEWDEGRIAVRVMVTKSGWRSQETRFTLTEWDPEEVWGRATFVLAPDSFRAQADRAAALTPQVECSPAGSRP